jgi:hypothetical protein
LTEFLNLTGWVDHEAKLISAGVNNVDRLMASTDLSIKTIHAPLSQADTAEEGCAESGVTTRGWSPRHSFFSTEAIAL